MAPSATSGCTTSLSRARKGRTPCTSPPARKHSSTTPRCAMPARGPARPARRPRIRLRVVARLGRQGHGAARHPRRHRRELRADPPLEPRRHGRPAAPVPAGRLGVLTGPDRSRDVHDRGACRSARAARAPWQRARHGRRGRERRFEAIARLDGPIEVDYYRQGGILPAVLRRLARPDASRSSPPAARDSLVTK